jgi:hypothetical protein
MIIGDQRYSGLNIGFGCRLEGHSYALDGSLMNLQLVHGTADHQGTFIDSGSAGASFMKIEALFYRHPDAGSSRYMGGGVSFGGVRAEDVSPGGRRTSWSGSGSQMELTSGYEFGRSSENHMFLQGTVVLPLYSTHGTTTTRLAGSTMVSSHRRYTPTFSVSLGMGL